MGESQKGLGQRVVPRVVSVQREGLRDRLGRIPFRVDGRVIQVGGTLIEASLQGCDLGALVRVATSNETFVLGEVVALGRDRAQIMPFEGVHGIAPGARVRVEAQDASIRVTAGLLGRVIDPFGRPLDGGPPLAATRDARVMPLLRPAPNPMERPRVSRPMGLGVRSIDALLTFGEGQRIGIMAGSGVGKSILMGMIARGSTADVNVIGLVGERGREVREFIERDLGTEGLQRSVVVVSTGDQSPLLKIRAARAATSIAEYFSGLNRNVMLMVDSLTRVATAQREVGLAIGEPPTTKGYTPSVFSTLQQLLERSGPQIEGAGFISGLYTVLVDGDDFNDPVADTARAILDGHINLTRSLAAKGHFPAIDVPSSTSRVMHDIVSPEHWKMATRLRGLLGTYQENIDLVQAGLYQRGANPVLDEALRRMPMIERFLKQDLSELSGIQDSLRGLASVLHAAVDASGTAAAVPDPRTQG